MAYLNLPNKRIKNINLMSTTKVFVSGNFNVIHPGHIRLLTFASSLGGELIVALNPEGAKDAYVPEFDRIAGVKALSIVDYCYVMTSPLLQELERIKPQIIVKGSEHINDTNEEREFVKKFGGEIVFSSGESWEGYSGYSEVKKLERHHLAHDHDYLKRHEITPSKLRSIIDNFENLKALVLGDIIVDEYVDVEPLGMSREDISIVTTPIASRRYLGGAGVVALQARALGAKVGFYSMTGVDELRDFCCDALDCSAIKHSIFEDSSRPTTYKLRYKAENKTLFRLSKIRQHPIDPLALNKIIVRIKEELPGHDLLIFSDFSYGFIAPEMIREVTDLCQQYGILVVADSQSSSQNGRIGKFINTDLITPTEFEARQALDNYSDGLVTIASQMIERFGNKNLLVTLGREGVLIQRPKDTRSPFITDQIQALNKSPVNISGAGDALLTCSALALASGASIWEAAYIGSIGAGLKISKNGNDPVPFSEIQEELFIK
jgi:rfaE bifunctional protein kinase chain/domain